MIRRSRVILTSAIVLACWVVYALLALAAGQQRLPGGGYGELYGPLAWLRDGCFWIAVVASILSVAATPLLLRRRASAE